MKNKQVLTLHKGDADQMIVQTIELAPPLTNEVQVKIESAGLAWADVMIRQGLYPDMPKFPVVQGFEFVGIVTAVGDDTHKDWIGKHVTALTTVGGYSQYTNVDPKELIELPQDMDMDAAACLSLNYMTAYQMMVRRADLKAGDIVLIHGAAGGVGTALLQLAKHLELKVYATASRGKWNAIDDGIITLIDYRKDDFHAIVSKLEPNGINAYFDIGARRVFDKSFRLLKPGGTGITYGFSEIKSLFQFLGFFVKVFIRDKTTNKNISMFSLKKKGKKELLDYKSDFSNVIKLLNNGVLSPVIAKRITLDQVVETHKEFEAHNFIGKIIIKPHQE